MGKKSLVALDTDHIKQYVFATDKLQEIRGASSILDFLNRKGMESVAGDEAFHAKTVYTNGGSGLFLIDGDKTVAEEFGQRIQHRYSQETKDGASITFAVEEIPERIQDPWDNDIEEILELLRAGLAEQKNCPSDIMALPSHPFMRLCDACGTRYAEHRDPAESRDEISRGNRYCSVCWEKRLEDERVKRGISSIIDERIARLSGQARTAAGGERPYIWEKIIHLLPATYDIPAHTERPSDFNKFREFSRGKDYLALIYADGNGMGQLMGGLKKLTDVKNTAELIDETVYLAMSDAIRLHLPVIPASKNEPPMFPFDILLIGGDDIMIVTPASVALDVAYTIARTFHEQTRGKGPGGESYTLSVGVILAPIKYPFGLLQDLAESTLKFAKKEGARRRSSSTTAFGDTCINFLTVTGSTSNDFKKVYDSLYRKKVRVDGNENVAFYATLRPYSVEELKLLLDAIRAGKQEKLGRTKLHQVREAIMRMNLTTSVYEGMAILNNWRPRQRDFVMQHVYGLGRRYQEPYRNADKPGTMFPRVTFPWFADGPDTYRTSLLDYVELYDFVEQEGEGDDATN